MKNLLFCFDDAKVGGFLVGSKYFSYFLFFGSDTHLKERQARMGGAESVVSEQGFVDFFITNYRICELFIKRRKIYESKIAIAGKYVLKSLIDH